MQILKINQSYIKEVDNNIVLHTIKLQTKQCSINIMLDSGSTHTIVNKKIADKLGVRKLNKTTIIIENSHRETEYECDMVEINLNELVITAYSIDTDLITLDVNESLVIKMWPNLDSHILMKHFKIHKKDQHISLLAMIIIGDLS